jgi:hypothetical protein
MRFYTLARADGPPACKHGRPEHVFPGPGPRQYLRTLGLEKLQCGRGQHGLPEIRDAIGLQQPHKLCERFVCVGHDRRAHHARRDDILLACEQNWNIAGDCLHIHSTKPGMKNFVSRDTTVVASLAQLRLSHTC